MINLPHFGHLLCCYDGLRVQAPYMPLSSINKPWHFDPSSIHQNKWLKSLLLEEQFDIWKSN